MDQVEGIGTESRKKLSKVINASKGGLTPDLVRSVLGVSRQEAGRLLSRWNKAGWLQRIKRGFYVHIPVESSPNKLAIENPWIVVSKIFEPGYVGGYSAIKHWDFSEQIFETITFFTTKKIQRKTPVYSGLKIQLKVIPESKLFGAKAVWFDSIKIQVSDPSKTMIDLLDDPALGGGMSVIRDFFKSYWESKHRNIDLLIEYGSKMKNNTIFKRLGFLLEVMNIADDKILNKIKTRISAGYSKFDPTVINSRIIRKWNLRIPSSWSKEYDR